EPPGFPGSFGSSGKGLTTPRRRARTVGAMLILKSLITTAGIVAVFLSAPDAAAAPARTRVPLAPIAAQLVRDGAPGALVAVRTPTAFRRAARGLGQRQPRVALRATDTFRVASITKPFVATVVLQLAAQGRLGLDDSVERWLPDLVPGGGAITI